jgi:hypothetical protein
VVFRRKHTMHKPAKFDLYVDCVPVFGPKGKAIDFSALVAPIAAKVAEEAGLADARFVKYESKPRLVEELRAALASFPTTIVVQSTHTHADVFLEVAVPHARKYVRAMRG